MQLFGIVYESPIFMSDSNWGDFWKNWNNEFINESISFQKSENNVSCE